MHTKVDPNELCISGKNEKLFSDLLENVLIHLGELDMNLTCALNIHSESSHFSLSNSLPQTMSKRL